jgi:sugar lactone lactonase YvrE
MKTKLTKTKFGSAFGRVRQLLKRVVWLGAVILICSAASAQNMFVSGNERVENCLGTCGAIYKFTWDGSQSIFTVGLNHPWDLGFDGAGNLFVVDNNRDELFGEPVIYKITPNGLQTIFASGFSYPSYLAVDKAGNLFVADYYNGIIYEYKPSGSRATFASGLYHPVGMAFDSAGNLWVADNSVGNIYQGNIYKYNPNGSRVTVAALNPGDRPADLAFDGMGNLYMADLGGKIYRYDLSGALRRQGRTTFGSVPKSAQSLGFDSAGNLFVVDAGGANDAGSAMPNAIYRFTQQGARSAFASVDGVGASFACLAFQPIPCCQ